MVTTAAAGGGDGNGSGSGSSSKPVFSLVALLGGAPRGPLDAVQVQLMQRAIRCLKEGQVARNLGALAAMPPADLQTLLNSNQINVPEVGVGNWMHGCVSAA
jgi:hypothetical protein